MHLNSQLIFKKYALDYFKNAAKVLEIGPDGTPSTYQKLANHSGQWDSADFHREGCTHTYRLTEEYSFPIESGLYDVVLSGQVIEHVRKPWRWLPEVARVCKPGGFVITINPVSWPYHEDPVDCWRIYPEGMRALYDDAGLEVILSEWETLEMPDVWRKIPGQSFETLPTRVQMVERIAAKFGGRVECAYDAITIGRKLNH